MFLTLSEVIKNLSEIDEELKKDFPDLKLRINLEESILSLKLIREKGLNLLSTYKTENEN